MCLKDRRLFYWVPGYNVVLLGCVPYTDKKENKIFLIYKEIQRGSGAKSYMRKGFLICEEMLKYFYHI
jgi:hypothetical protein